MARRLAAAWLSHHHPQTQSKALLGSLAGPQGCPQRERRRKARLRAEGAAQGPGGGGGAGMIGKTSTSGKMPLPGCPSQRLWVTL